MLKGLWIAFKRVINNPLVEDADADVGAPYARLCNALKIYDKNDGDLDCDAPDFWYGPIEEAPAKVIPEPASTVMHMTTTPARLPES
jgi:hypothetical protein